MEIYVLNRIIEKWRKYNNLKETLETLNKKRQILGEQLRLRKYDIDQHLVNALQSEGTPAQYAYAKKTICEVIMQCEDNDVICAIYRALYSIMDKHTTDAQASILAMKVTDKVADVDETIQRLTDQAEAYRNEAIANYERIEKLKSRTWWQRLLNKE